MASINKDTKIEFSLSMFFSTIGTVITIFLAFYFVVQKPSNDSVKNYAKEQFESQKMYLDEKFKHIDESLTTFSSGLSNLTKQVQELNNRDLDISSQDGNTSGGFN